MNSNGKFYRSMVKVSVLVLVLGVLMLGGTINSPARTIRVPQDRPTIAAAIGAASAGDTIQVDKGDWCGAEITKPLDLEGNNGARIIGCSSSPVNPIGWRLGFRMDPAASGTIIHNFVFDGRGISDSNMSPLAICTAGYPGANNVVVEGNNFLGGFTGINDFGSGWVISQNVFDGYSISCATEAGGYAVGLWTPSSAANVVVSNQMKTNNVPHCNLSSASWISEVFVLFAGVVVSGQNGAVIADNEISINADGTGNFGAGIIAAGEISGVANTNLVIFDNNTQKNTYGLIVTSGDTTGATIYNNNGVNLINGVKTIVK
jgi:hypothetical protein